MQHMGALRSLGSVILLGVLHQTCTAQAIPFDKLNPFTQYAVAAHVSSLGYGGDVTTGLTNRLNLVFSASAANYGYSEHAASGTTYLLHYRPRNAALRIQIFPLSGPHTGSFFFTGGALLTTHDWITGKMTAPPGQTFSWNGTRYESSPSDPVYGTVAFGASRLAYTFGVGFTNVLRSRRGFSFPIEVGVIGVGEPHARTYPAGSVCNVGGANCRLESADPTVQANQLAEAQRVAGNHTAWQYVPIVTVGVAYHFDHGRFNPGR